MTYSGIFRHNQAYLRIFRNYSGIFCTLYKPGIFRTHMAYSNPGIFKTRDIFRTMWYIQNSDTFRTRGIFRIPGYSEPELYSEPCQTSTVEHFEKQLTAINILQVIIIFAISAFHVPYFMK